jgi:hypothetical protein
MLARHLGRIHPSLDILPSLVIPSSLGIRRNNQAILHSLVTHSIPSRLATPRSLAIRPSSLAIRPSSPVIRPSTPATRNNRDTHNNRDTRRNSLAILVFQATRLTRLLLACLLHQLHLVTACGADPR